MATVPGKPPPAHGKPARSSSDTKPTPGSPFGPGGPDGPAGPRAPMSPLGPVAPAGPPGPVEPVAPTTPAGPDWFQVTAVSWSGPGVVMQLARLPDLAVSTARRTPV